MATDRTVQQYIAAAAPFAKPILTHLRGIIIGVCPEAVETIKWGIPHFDYKGEMMCMLAAYKQHCSFSFWKADLMTYPELKGNSQLKAPQRFMGKLTALADLPPDKELKTLVKEAMALNDKGVKIAKPKSEKPSEIAVPDYFIKALAGNKQAKKIFEEKSNAYRKDYLIWITGAKTDATRDKRIEESLEWIAAGKSRFWKYEK